jgi:hypothetical protein
LPERSNRYWCKGRSGGFSDMRSGVANFTLRGFFPRKAGWGPRFGTDASDFNLILGKARSRELELCSKAGRARGARCEPTRRVGSQGRRWNGLRPRRLILRRNHEGRTPERLTEEGYNYKKKETTNTNKPIKNKTCIIAPYFISDRTSITFRTFTLLSL